MAQTNESKIDTKLFLSTSERIGAVHKELEGCFQEWIKAAQSLRGCWQGDTSDNIKNTAEAVSRSASELLRALGGYGAALNELAGIYDKTEQNVQETGKSLKFEKMMR